VSSIFIEQKYVGKLFTKYICDDFYLMKSSNFWHIQILLFLCIFDSYSLKLKMPKNKTSKYFYDISECLLK